MRHFIDIIESVDQGEFLPENLYHGSRETFDQFDLTKARTAQHIYTSPDIATARYYGPVVYQCHARGPQADITDEGDHRLLKRLADEFAGEFEDHVRDDAELAALRAQIVTASGDPDMVDWEAEDDPSYQEQLRQIACQYAYEVFQGGKIYEVDMRGRLQDDVLSTLFSWGYRSVRFIDHNPAGESLSVVAEGPEDIEIVQRL